MVRPSAPRPANHSQGEPSPAPPANSQPAVEESILPGGNGAPEDADVAKLLGLLLRAARKL